MKGLISRTLFFIGWMLSPLTFWNDAFVNIPVAYLLASAAARVVRADFLLLVLVFYWLSNIAGIIIMYGAGKRVFSEGKGVTKSILSLVLTMAAYSLLLILLGKFGVLRPIGIN